MSNFLAALSLLACFLFVRAQRPMLITGEYNDVPPNVRVELLPNLSTSLTCRVAQSVDYFTHKLDFFKCNGSVQQPDKCELLSTRALVVADRSKYKVQISPQTDGVLVQLQILDVQPSDEAIYKCDLINEIVSGQPNDRLVGGAAFNLIVRQKVSSVRFANTSTVQVRGDRIRLERGRASSLVCEALGGYPPPKVEVFSDGSEITERMQRTQEWTRDGLLTRLTLDNFKIDDLNWEHQKIRCTAFVDDSAFDRFGVTDTKKIQLAYAPHIEPCTTVDNRVLGRPSTLVCTIMANPPLHHVHWEIEHMNVTLQINETSTPGLHAFYEERVFYSKEFGPSVKYVVHLHIANVTQHHRGKYTLRVGNRLGSNSTTYEYKPERPVHIVETVASYRASSACTLSVHQKFTMLAIAFTLLAIHRN